MTARSGWAWSVAVVLGGLLIAPLGCSDDEETAGTKPSPKPDAAADADAGEDAAPTESGTDAEPDAGPPAFYARFELPGAGADPIPFLSVPFPSDAYMNDDGTLVDSFPGIEKFIPKAPQAASFTRQLGDSLGFGTSGGSMFELQPGNPSVNASTVPATEEVCGKPGSGAFLIDLSETGTAMMVPCEALWHDDRVWNPATKFLPPVLTVKPARGIKLGEGHRIAALVTSAIHDVDDNPLGASPAFRAIRDGDDRTSAFAQAYGAAIDQIVAAQLPGLDDITVVSSMTLYDTGEPTKDMLAAREVVMAEAVPTISWDGADTAPMGTGRFNAGSTVLAGFDATLDEAMGTPPKTPSTYYLGEVDDPGSYDDNGLPHDAIGAIATGAYMTPNFLIAGDDTYADPTEGTFYRESGAPMLNPARPAIKIWVTVVIPNTPPPAEGYPVIIFQHGIAHDRWDMVSGINDWAKMGFATVAIDLIQQGARAPSTNPGWNKDEKSSLQGTYDGPDGLSDVVAPATALLAGLVGIGAIRDQFRQNALDLVNLVRVIKSNPDLGPLTVAQPGAKLDGNNIQMMAVSLGGIIGTTAVALSPDIDNVVLNVTGASIGHEILPGDAWDGATLTAGFISGWGAITHMDLGNPLTTLIAHVTDPGDSLTFAPYVFKSPLTLDGSVAPRRNVLAIAAIDDEVVWNGSNDALARALGLAVATPNKGVSVPMPTTSGTAGVFFDAPEAGYTAVYMQQGAASHARNFYGPISPMVFEWPYPRFDDAVIFPAAAEPFDMYMPYHQAHEMVGTFLMSGSTGGVPEVHGYVDPPDDYDGDGVENADDTDPSDPNVQ